ncbi:MAG: hypothetical protein K2K82_07685 [Muribaculaceae bacterium]|nr:hypothetical protein [Muribaculaceae bacterium]
MAQPDKRTPQGKHAILHEALGKTIVIANGLLATMNQLIEIAANHPDAEEAIRFTLLTLDEVSGELRGVQRAIAKVNAQLAMEVDNPYD